MNFRLDISGLRAIAVLAVVFFHFNESWLPGGYAGVDVFFVISGYLMTGIIFSRLQKNNLSLIGFYAARARRILPTLSILCLVLLLLAWFFLSPPDYETLGLHVASSATFISNVIFWRESGYFDAAAHEKWLLHTWSLSVEWQFYMLYPIILLLFSKIFSLKQISRVVAVGTLLGFVFCVFASYYWPNPSFYLLPTRAWEMLLGGLAFLYPLSTTDSRKGILAWCGFILIILSYLLIADGVTWPGYLALFPVVGAFLIIVANKQDFIVTNNLPFQYIGKASYSIYLWHWPIVVFINYMGGSGSISFALIGIVTSIAIGFISYYLIENSLSKLNSKYVNRIVFVLFSIVLSSSLFINANKGITNRVDDSYFQLMDKLVMPTRDNGYCFYSFLISEEVVGETEGTSCLLGNKKASANTILFGDSFGGHYEPFWDVIFSKNNLSIKSITTNWCFPSLEKSFPGPVNHPAYHQCQINRAYVASNMASYKNIILAGSWRNIYEEGYTNEVIEFANYSVAQGVNVFIMASPTSYDTNVLKRFSNSLFNEKFAFDLSQMPKSKDILTREVNSLLADYATRTNHVYFINREEMFKSSDSFTLNGMLIPYSLDGGHISLEGAKQAAKLFMSNNTDVYLQLLKEAK